MRKKMLRKTSGMLLVLCGILLVGACGKDPVIKSNEFVKQGFQLYKSNEYDKAIEAFKRAIDINPGNAQAHYYLGVVYKDYKSLTDNRVASIKELEAAIAADISFMDAYVMLCSMYMNDGKFEEAAAVAQRAIKVKYDDAEPHYWLAQSYFQRQMFQETKDECKRGLTVNPDHGGCRQLLVEAEQNL
jgi:tetratricopeptide (TPR) repeat protein